MKVRPLIPESTTIASWRNFQKLEPMIATVCAHFPKTVTFHPKELAPSTFLTYLKSAMMTFLHHDCQWPASFTKEKIQNLFESGLAMEYNNVEKSVTVSCKQHETNFNLNQTSVSIDEMVSGDDEDVVFAIALLKDREVLKSPVMFSGLSDSLISRLSEKFANISIAPDPHSPSITTMF